MSFPSIDPITRIRGHAITDRCHSGTGCFVQVARWQHVRNNSVGHVGVDPFANASVRLLSRPRKIKAPLPEWSRRRARGLLSPERGCSSRCSVFDLGCNATPKDFAPATSPRDRLLRLELWLATGDAWRADEGKRGPVCSLSLGRA